MINTVKLVITIIKILLLFILLVGILSYSRKHINTSERLQVLTDSMAVDTVIVDSIVNDFTDTLWQRIYISNPCDSLGNLKPEVKTIIRQTTKEKIVYQIMEVPFKGDLVFEDLMGVHKFEFDKNTHTVKKTSTYDLKKINKLIKGKYRKTTNWESFKKLWWLLVLVYLAGLLTRSNIKGK